MPIANLQEANGVHVGRDGWLFLTGGSNEALRLLVDPSLFVEEDAQNWASKLADRLERVTALGARYFHMWVPDKIKVYREYLNFDPGFLTVDPPRMVHAYAQELGIQNIIVDLLPGLLNRKDQQLLYWKTDTHWTYWGACCAYLALCEATAATPLEDMWDRPIHHVELTLDLGSKLSPPIQERLGIAQILRDSKIVYKNELLRFIEMLNPKLVAPMLRGTSVGFKNSRTTCDKRRLLIFGDSFSEYRPHLLTGLIAETFQEVLFVWSTSIDHELIKEFKPDIVVSEMAERFIKTDPDKRIQEDGFDLRNFVFDRITSFLNRECGCSRNFFTWNTG